MRFIRLAFLVIIAIVSSVQAQSPSARVALDDGLSTIFSVSGPGNSLFTTINLAAGTYNLIVGGSTYVALGAGPIASLGERVRIRAALQFGPGQFTILPFGCNQQNADCSYYPAGGSSSGSASHAFASVWPNFGFADGASAGWPAASPVYASVASAVSSVALSGNTYSISVDVDAQAVRTVDLTTVSVVAQAGFCLNATIILPQPMQIAVGVSALGMALGQSQSAPLPPSNPPSLFRNAPTGNWFDPPLALGYDFQQTGSSLFTDILSLPVGIDSDGLFEVIVGNQSLGQFPAGGRVDFRTLLSGPGVPAFRIVGINPAVDATDVEAFPVQLAFDTATADFTMTPVLWRHVGSSCADPVSCASCPTMTLDPVGNALAGNLAFALGLSNAQAGGLGIFTLGFGRAQPQPFFCGTLAPTFPPLVLGLIPIGGAGPCGGSATMPLGLPNVPGMFGTFLTVQAGVLCPAGGIGLTQGLEFPVGS